MGNGTRFFLHFALVAILALGLGARPAHATSEGGREFLAACTYGVLAGTLVGAASLAFVSKPGDNLHRVARGASLGLYTGILLGLYVVYAVPAMQPKDENPLLGRRLNLFPLISPHGVDGAQAQLRLADW